MSHVSVLFNESIAALDLRHGMTIVDGTFGAGGHSLAIASAIGKDGHLISFDADASVFSQEKVQELGQLTRFTNVVSNFREAGEVLKRLEIGSIDGALFDLGLSSTQLEASGRGFSFLRDEPLSMTFACDPQSDTVTAMTVLNDWSEASIQTILSGFGEERFARSIARGIVAARTERPIETTFQLVEIIKASTPSWYQRGRTHPATRTFQAVRMAVNGELDAITEAITAIAPKVKLGGRIAVISFHSIEDRLVKQQFLELCASGRFERVTKKPIIPTPEEISANPRSRSAKLRVIRALSA